MNPFPLLQLPDAALATVAAAVMGDAKARDALRSSCARMRAVVDAQATSVCFRDDAGGYPHLRSGLPLDALPALAARFPRAATITFRHSHCPLDVSRRLAALPGGCWPAVTKIDAILAPTTATQLARLCPNLRDVYIASPAADGGFGALCAALEALAAAGAPFETLTINIDLAACGGGAAVRASAALARLGSRLRVLGLCVYGPKGAAVALPSLAALTALETVELTVKGRVAPSLGAGWAPPQLKRLIIDARMDGPKGACTSMLRSGALFPELVHLDLKGDDWDSNLDLADVAAACPRLDTLQAKHLHMVHSGGALQHLTCLDLEFTSGGAPWPDLARAAPRLQEVYAGVFAEALAFEKHPALRSASLNKFDPDGADGADEWMEVYTTLPRLDTLELWIHHNSFSAFSSDHFTGSAPRRHEAGFAHAAAYLARCTGLTRLFLAPVFDVPLPRVMAALGGAVGARLAVLELDYLTLPESEDEAARTLRALPLFPRLERLTMEFQADTEGGWSHRRYKGPVLPPLRALLAPVGALRPASAALASIAIQLNRAEAAPGELEAVGAICRELSAANPGLHVTFKQGP